MAATIVICESNGAGETITHNISDTDMGSSDSATVDPVASPITPGNRSYAKYQKFHCTALGGSSRIDNLQVWRTGSLGTGGSHAHVTNARTSSYATIAYATPTASAVSGADQTMPTSDPGAANLGIGGNNSLAGAITAAHATTHDTTTASDYLIHQITTDSSATAGSTTTMNYQYDETA
jgi:hypothetical protein